VRLPWPFGRSTSDDGASSGAAPLPPAAAPAPIPPTGAWRTLPPIQRASGPPPVVAPASTFLAEVPGHAPLPPIVTPLGHEAGPDGPPGLVVAHPHAVPSLTSHTPLTNRPVQRHASGDGDDAPTTAWTGVADDDAPVVARQAATTPPTVPPRPGPGTTSSPAPELPPIRTVAPVPASATVTPPARPYTQAAPLLAPLPATVSRSAASASTSSGSGARQAGLAMPIQSSARLPKAVAPASASAAPDAPLPPVRRFTELPAGTSAPAVQRELQGSRRAGLGAPIPSAPASAVAQRLPQPGQPRSTPPALPAATSPDGAVSSVPSATPPAAGLDARRPLPVLSVARRQDAAPADASTVDPARAPLAARPALAAAPTTLVVARQASTVVPTLGARPLRPSVTVPPIAPLAGNAAEGGSSAGLVAPLPEGPVPARWGGDDALPATVTTIPSIAAGHAVPVQRARVDAPARPAATPAMPATREITFPPRDADPDASPALDAASPVPSPVARSAPAAVAAAPSIQRATAPLALVRPIAPVAAPAPVAAAASAAPAPTVARIVADPASPGAAPTVQTSPAAGSIPVGTFTATPIVQREEGASPAQAAEQSGTPSDRELDELAKQLFGRLRTQLKSEVIHEREAKGLGFDAF
jgi:hypothetical protein